MPIDPVFSNLVNFNKKVSIRKCSKNSKSFALRPSIFFFESQKFQIFEQKKVSFCFSFIAFIALFQQSVGYVWYYFWTIWFNIFSNLLHAKLMWWSVVFYMPTYYIQILNLCAFESLTLSRSCLRSCSFASVIYITFIWWELHNNDRNSKLLFTG